MKPDAEWRLFRIGGVIAIYVFAFFSGFYLHGAPTDIQVNIEYTNGILAATGILFGIWAIVLGRKPTTIIRKFLFKNSAKELFFYSLFFLVMDAVFLALTAVNAFSPVVTLFMVTVAFVYTALFLAHTLNYYIFED